MTSWLLFRFAAAGLLVYSAVCAHNDDYAQASWLAILALGLVVAMEEKPE